MVSAAREAAFEILRRVAVEGAFAGHLLGSPRYDSLSREDRHLLQELTLGVLRRQGWLDFLIEHYAGRPLRALDLEVILALRLGLYQQKVLTRIPSHAAINESVNLVKQVRKKSAAPFVNAVLRAAQREGEFPPEKLPADPLARLGVVASHPAWLLKRWVKRWGLEEATALAIRNNQTPEQSFRYNIRLAPRERTDLWLAGHGVSTHASSLVPDAAVIDQGFLAPDSPPIQEGWIYLQEESSQLVAHLATPSSFEGSPYRVWDVCAAPGGKSSLIASLLPAGSFHAATDLHRHRIQLMREQFRRQGLERINLAQVDLSRGSPFSDGSFQQVLVDAPCSGLGTLQKHPEIKWRLTPDKIGELAALQKRLLEEAAASLSPGGLLTYSVCSTEAEEGEEVIAWFRDRHPEYRDLTRERLVELGLDPAPLLTPSFGARTFPHRHHTEGFFVCILWKRR